MAHGAFATTTSTRRYWEQQVEWGASIHPELSSDRMNADGVRLQAWWAQNFRFLPASLNHALVGRITQYCMDDLSLTVPMGSRGLALCLALRHRGRRQHHGDHPAR